MFLLIFLFNVGGYYLVFLGVQYKAKQDLLQRLDADNYSNDDVVVLTLPMSLPYPMNKEDYERVNGEFEYKGEFYRLVKQKLENDTLFMVCIKDRQQKNITNVMNDFAKVANNLPTSSKQTLNLFAKLFKDFTQKEVLYCPAPLGVLISHTSAGETHLVPAGEFPVPTPPPDKA